MGLFAGTTMITKRAAPLALSAGAALCAMAAPDRAAAQIQITHSPSIAPDLGRVVRGNSATTFTIAPSGTVTRASGNSIRVSSASATAPTINISCGLLNLNGLCALRPIRVTIQPVPNASAQITKFTVGAVAGNILWATGSAPVPGSSVTFDLKPLGLLGTGSFTLGMDVLMAAGLNSGNYRFDYVVTASFI